MALVCPVFYLPEHYNNDYYQFVDLAAFDDLDAAEHWLCSVDWREFYGDRRLTFAGYAQYFSRLKLVAGCSLLSKNRSEISATSIEEKKF
ncbi:MAG: hypothetical protein V7629_00855 [Motiliproteus sp.]